VASGHTENRQDLEWVSVGEAEVDIAFFDVKTRFGADLTDLNVEVTLGPILENP
jgi:hypothetical protein